MFLPITEHFMTHKGLVILHLAIRLFVLLPPSYKLGKSSIIQETKTLVSIPRELGLKSFSSSELSHLI